MSVSVSVSVSMSLATAISEYFLLYFMVVLALSPQPFVQSAICCLDRYEFSYFGARLVLTFQMLGVGQA